MIEWPVGLSTGCFYQVPVLDCLDMIRATGFSILELSTAPDHLDYKNSAYLRKLRKTLRSLALEAYSLHAPWGEHIDISSPKDSLRRQSVDELGQVVNAAGFLGARYVVVHPGPERDDLPVEERSTRMLHTAAALNELAGACQRAGVQLVLENKLPHLFSGQLCDLLWHFGSIQGGPVGLCLDTGHAFLARNLAGILDKMGGHICMVHASDNLGRFDDHLAPGKGGINWRNVLGQLASCGFRGALILELAPLASPQASLEDAVQARQFLRLAMRSVEPART